MKAFYILAPCERIGDHGQKHKHQGRFHYVEQKALTQPKEDSAEKAVYDEKACKRQSQCEDKQARR
jgi:hypothetical protein